MSVRVRSLRPEDHARWLELWSQYQTFYAVALPPDATAATWQRLHDDGHGNRRRIHGLGVENEAGTLAGIVHFLFHEDTWSTAPACYLQDLYVDPAARGRGCARRLLEAVATAAKASGASPPYWLTHQSNATARTLYDRVGRNYGFIHYAYQDPDA